jgi:hypothetical protein
MTITRVLVIVGLVLAVSTAVLFLLAVIGGGGGTG